MYIVNSSTPTRSVKLADCLYVLSAATMTLDYVGTVEDLGSSVDTKASVATKEKQVDYDQKELKTVLF